jgi:hypothetical protein
MLNISVLDDLSTFEYVELIDDILENWIFYVECGMWNELCNCVLRLEILNIVFGVWEIGVVTCLWILGSVLQIVLEHIVLGRGYTILGVPRARVSLFESRTRLLEPGALGTCICIHILWCVWVCYFHDMYIVVSLGGLVCIWILMAKNICTWMYMGILVFRI